MPFTSMKTINVGITSIGSGVGQSVVDSCRLSGLPLRIFGYGNNPFAYGAYACDEQRILPSIYAGNYLDELVNHCEHDHIDVLIPGLDDELLLLAECQSRFEEIGVFIPLSSPSLLRLCLDKELMSKELNSFGGHFVRSFGKAELHSQLALGVVEFPLIAKPRNGFASRGLIVIRSPSDLERISENYVIQELAFPARSDASFSSFEKALQKGEISQVGEVSLQIVIGRDGAELGRYASYNKLQNGVPVEIVPARMPEVWSAADTLLPSFLDLGLRGPLNIQGRITESGPKFFEMNARFTGITGLRAMTGFNEVEAIIRDAMRLPMGGNTLRQSFRRIGLRQVANKVVDLSFSDELANACRASGVICNEPYKRRILVTGANSYLGRALLDALVANDHFDEIYALVRDKERFDGVVEPTLPDGVAVITVEDLRHGNSVLGMVDIICHVASARPIYSHEALAESLAFTQFITALATMYQVSGFINISSQSVYGTGRQPLWSEETPVAPETSYAQSKWAGELLASGINKLHPHCGVTSLRLGQIIGPSKVVRYSELPHKFIKDAMSGKALSVWGGEQLQDYIDVRDAAELISLLCKLPCSSWEPVLNVSGGNPVKVAALAEACIAVAQSFGVTPVDVELRKDFRAPSFGMSIEKVKTSTGWCPQFDLTSTLRSLVNGLWDATL